MRLKLAIVAASLVALASMSAYALDDASKTRRSEPKKITKCRTINKAGSYIVSRNLTAKGNCIVIEADDVIIDLDGFVLFGDGTGAGVTDNEVYHRSITVRDGTVTGFENGIDLFASSASIASVRAIKNQNDGIRTGSFGRGVISSLTFDNYEGFGIRTRRRNYIFDNITGGFGSGILVTGSGSGVVSNHVSSHTGSGIIGRFMLVRVNEILVRGNNVSSNEGDGISVGSGSEVNGNVARANGGVGIEVDCPSPVYGNTATFSGFSDEPLGPGNFRFNGDADECFNVYNVGDINELVVP